MMRASLAPRPAQACTNSRPPSDTNSPRTSRAMLGQETAAIAMISLETEGERIATINRAKMKAGMVWKNSVMRISTVSVRAVSDFRRDVAAERVGAEQKAPARRLQGGSNELERIIGVDHRREHDEQEQAQQHGCAEQCHPVAREPREARPHVKSPCAGRA